MDGHALRWPVYEAMTGRIDDLPFEDHDTVLSTVWLIETVDGEIRNGGFAQLVFNLRHYPEFLERVPGRLRLIGADGAVRLFEEYFDSLGGNVRELIEDEGPFDLPDEAQDPSFETTMRWLDLQPSPRVLLGRYLDAHLKDPAVRELIESDRFRTPDFDLDEALHTAIFNRDPERVGSLLRKGADPNSRDKYDESPLSRLAGQSGDSDVRIEIAEILIRAGAEVDGGDEDGFTALHGCRDAKLAAALIKAGADPNARSADGRTPLHLAASGLYDPDDPIDEELFDVLLESGADPKALADDGSDLFKPIKNHVGAYEYFAKRAVAPHAEADERGLHGETALHKAAVEGWVEAATFLLEHGIDPNVRLRRPGARDELFAGATPLDAATANDKDDVVGLLREAGGVSGERLSYSVILRSRGQSPEAVLVALEECDLVPHEREKLGELVAGVPAETGGFYDHETGSVKLPAVVVELDDESKAEEVVAALNEAGADAVVA